MAHSRQRLLVTGDTGVIGTVLTKGLAHDISGFSLPEHDAGRLAELEAATRGHDAIVHLAWNTADHNSDGRAIDPHDITMVHNVFEAALRTGVPRVILASSVHADRFDEPRRSRRTPYDPPQPDSPYGASKVGAEALGRYYASLRLEVICIRFGDVNAQNQPHPDPGVERQVWLSHGDCVALIKAVLASPVVAERHTIMYAVSDNLGSVHDTTNPFGWAPHDGVRD